MQKVQTQNDSTQNPTFNPAAQTAQQVALTEKVIDIIFSSLNLKHIDRSSVNSSTVLGQGGLNLDSIDILELIVNFENSFGIKLNESESYAQHFKNIGSIVEFVETQTKK